MRRIVGVLFIVGLVAGWSGTGVPPETVLERLQAEVNPETDPFVGSWRMLTSSVVEKPSGKAHHEAKMEIKCSRDTQGALHREVIRFVKDGKDETEQIRKRLARQDAKREAGRKKKKRKKDDTGPGADFVPPDLEHRDLYVFEPLPAAGDGSARCRFHPTPVHEKDRGLLSGELAWDPETLDPRWIEGDLLHPPAPLKRMHLRIEFRRAGDLLYSSRMVTDGLIKLLLLKRRFHADVRMEDVRPSPGR